MEIALIVDSPKRDLAGVTLVAHELLKLGIESYIVPMYQQGYDLALLAPAAVLVNYARLNNRALLLGYKALGIEVVVMDTEGGILSEKGSDSPDNWARLFKESKLDRCVDRYFFWGARVHDAFAAAGVLPPERLEVTGCPRYDFCHPRWSSLLTYPESGHVLVNTNFSAINPRFTASAESEIEIFTSTGWERDYTLRLFDDLRAVFPRYLDAIGGMARRNAHRKIVVRPHPFENPDLYRKRFERERNIVVDPSGNVLDTIKEADCVVHLNCGTAVETLLLGKTPIALEFLNTERMRSHAGLPSAISCGAADANDLDSLVNSVDDRERRWQAAPLLTRYILPWFHHIDGEASARVARSLAAGLQRRARRSRRSAIQSLRGGVRKPSAVQLAQGIASNLIGSLAVTRLRARFTPVRKDKDISREHVTSLLERLAGCDSEAVPARVDFARHPLTGAALSSLCVRPRARANLPLSQGDGRGGGGH